MIFFSPTTVSLNFLFYLTFVGCLLWVRCYAGYLRVNQLSDSSQHSHEAGAIMVLVVQMKKPRLGRL